MQAPRTSPTPTAPRAGSHAIRLGSPRVVKSWARGEEPAVADMLDDPVLRRLLARDRIEVEHLRSLMSDVRSRLLAR